MRSRTCVATAVLILVAPLGCAGPAPEARPESCSGKCDSASPEGAIAGPIVARCTNVDGILRCATALPESYPVRPLITATAQACSAVLVDGVAAPSGELRDVTRASGVATVDVVVSFASLGGVPTISDWPDGRVNDLVATLTVAPGQTAELALPFEAWPITLVGEPLAVLRTGGYSLPIAPFHRLVGDGPITLDGEVAKDLGARVDAVLLVPSGRAPLDASAQICTTNDCAEASVTLDGPGTYEVIDGTIRRTGPTTIVPPAPAAPAITPPPTCGTEGQARCVRPDGPQCADGFKYGSADDRCHAASACIVCGREGQPICGVDPKTGCDAGFVYSWGEVICRACGREGQPRCAVGSALTCDPGFSYSFADSACHAG